MEIGVYDGDNAVAMVRVASEGSPSTEVEYYGFDFFVNYSRAQISRKLDETGCKYWLYEGDTLETLPQAINDLPLMDLIFIDGGKSFAEARSDWEHSRRLMHSGSAIYVHNYEFQGVKRMVEGISMREYDVSVIREPYEGLVALVKTKKS